MARKQNDDQQELDIEQTPIGWYELSELMGTHERLWLEWETAKIQVKEVKAKYDESYANLRAAHRRVRRNAELEGRRFGNAALANRSMVRDVDPDTGEVLEA